MLLTGILSHQQVVYLTKNVKDLSGLGIPWKDYILDQRA